MGVGKSKANMNLPDGAISETATASSGGDTGIRRSCSSKHLLWGWFIFTGLWCVALVGVSFNTLDSVSSLRDKLSGWSEDQLRAVEAAIVFMVIIVLLWGVWSTLVLAQKFVLWSCGGTNNPFLSWGILIASTFYAALSIFAISIILTLYESTFQEYGKQDIGWGDSDEASYAATYCLGFICTALLALMCLIFFFRRPTMERLEKYGTQSAAV